MKSIQTNLEEILSKPTANGISTGIPSLDSAIHGLQNGHIIIIAGCSSMGKSSCLRSMVLSAAKEVPVGVIAIEGGQYENVEILLYSMARVNYSRRDRLDEFQKNDIENVKKELSKLNPIYFDEVADTMYPDWILERELKENSVEQCIGRMIKAGVKVVFIDYLQLIQWGSKYESETLRLKSITNKFTRMSLEHDIPIVLLSQLKKEVADRANRGLDPTPTLNDIRDSGYIVNDAHEVLLLHRPEYYNKTKELDLLNNCIEDAQIIVAKNRFGPTGSISVKFQPSCMLWFEDEKPDDPEEFGEF